MHIRSIGILTNSQKPAGIALVRQLAHACSAHGIHMLVEPWVALLDDTLTACVPEEMLRRVDALLVLGGDGTILHAVQGVAQARVPVLGVNIGHVGFLTEATAGDVHDTVAHLARGEYAIENRMLLEITAPGAGQPLLALNDAVVARGALARIVTVDVHVNGTLAGHYNADGVVVASPTGSTAYSLSAGGPVVMPSLDCIVLAPICAHTLNARPFVLSDRAEVSLRVAYDEREGSASLTVDGRAPIALANGASVRVRKAAESLSFIRLAEVDFFQLLRLKLTEWSR